MTAEQKATVVLFCVMWFVIGLWLGFMLWHK